MIAKFKCPVCNQYIASSTYESIPDDNGYKRRRKCEKCGARFVTIETIQRLAKDRKRSNENRRDVNGQSEPDAVPDRL